MITLDDVILPDDIKWIDEFVWDKIDFEKEYSVTGSLVTNGGTAKQAGRLITLQGSEDTAWITRQTLLALKTKAEVLNSEWVLTWIDGRTFDVIFDHSQIALEAEPLFHVIDPQLDHYYKVTIRLLEVS